MADAGCWHALCLGYSVRCVGVPGIVGRVDLRVGGQATAVGVAKNYFSDFGWSVSDLK